MRAADERIRAKANTEGDVRAGADIVTGKCAVDVAAGRGKNRPDHASTALDPNIEARGVKEPT